MTRRDYGTGSISQRSDGTWRGRVDLGRAPDGSRRRASVTGRSRREVQQGLARAIASREARFGAKPSERLSTAAFIDQWLTASAPASLRARTLAGYRSIAERHLKPAIGHVPLAKLNGAHIQDLVNRLMTAGSSPQTVRNVHAVLRRALGQAVRWGILARNPAATVDLPAGRGFDVHALSAEDAKAVLEAVRGDIIEPLVTVALLTGLRQGEALGLRWSDVDLDGGHIAVRRTVHRSGGKLMLEEPKTRRSRRTVPLTAWRRQLSGVNATGSRPNSGCWRAPNGRKGTGRSPRRLERRCMAQTSHGAYSGSWRLLDCLGCGSTIFAMAWQPC